MVRAKDNVIVLALTFVLYFQSLSAYVWSHVMVNAAWLIHSISVTCVTFLTVFSYDEYHLQYDKAKSLIWYSDKNV